MIYTAEQLDFIKNNCKTPRKALTDLFNKTFGTNQSTTAIRGVCKRNGWLMDREYWHFNKGCVPFNKGIKGRTGPNRTSFKKGNSPHNYRPVGSERITKDGYVQVKAQNPNIWKLKHVLNWESVYGEVPKNHCIVFIDGNKQNCNIENLQLITRNENVRFNKNGYSYYPAELRPTLRAMTKLDLATQQTRAPEKKTFYR